MIVHTYKYSGTNECAHAAHAYIGVYNLYVRQTVQPKETARDTNSTKIRANQFWMCMCCERSFLSPFLIFYARLQLYVLWHSHMLFYQACVYIASLNMRGRWRDRTDLFREHFVHTRYNGIDNDNGVREENPYFPMFALLLLSIGLTCTDPARIHARICESKGFAQPLECVPILVSISFCLSHVCALCSAPHLLYRAARICVHRALWFRCRCFCRRHFLLLHTPSSTFSDIYLFGLSLGALIIFIRGRICACMAAFMLHTYTEYDRLKLKIRE